MRKIILTLAILAFASPALAGGTIANDDPKGGPEPCGCSGPPGGDGGGSTSNDGGGLSQ